MTDQTTTPTPAEASAAIITLQRSSDPAARAEVQRLEAIEQGDTPAPAAAPAAAAAAASAVDHTARDTARARAAELQADPIFMKRWQGGDKAAHAELNKVIEEGNPGELDSHGMPIEETADSTGVDDLPPESSQKYQFDYGTVVGELDKALDAEARGLFHEAKLPNSVAALIFKKWNAVAGDAAKGIVRNDAALQLQAKASEYNLRSMWGAKYEAKMDAARSVLKALPADKYARAVQILDRSGIGNDPLLIAQLADLAARRAAAKK